MKNKIGWIICNVDGTVIGEGAVALTRDAARSTLRLLKSDYLMPGEMRGWTIKRAS
jgi:hypothetical protein